MASIERTAYPRFKRTVSARELRDAYALRQDEVEWARGLTRSDEHLLALTVLLKCFQRLGYFPSLDEVPSAVVRHFRDDFALDEAVPLGHDSDRTARYHKGLVRERLGVTADPERARAIAEQAIRSAAAVKDNPADLINVALEELVRARCELPAYSTLDRLTGRIRTEVNGAIFEMVHGRISPGDRARLLGLLDRDPITKRSGYDRVKETAPAATLSKFREHLDLLAWLTSDGGRTWRRFDAMAGGPVVSLFFDGPRHAVASFPGGSMLTDDGGRGWRPLTPPDPASTFLGPPVFLDAEHGCWLQTIGPGSGNPVVERAAVCPRRAPTGCTGLGRGSAGRAGRLPPDPVGCRPRVPPLRVGQRRRRPDLEPAPPWPHGGRRLLRWR